MDNIIKDTKIIKVDRCNPQKEKIREAARYLIQGEVVAFPTETVYGLGANALDPKAVKKIFAAKGRPADNPLIVHISEPEAIKYLAGRFPDSTWPLIKQFWPGPLTIILPKKEIVPMEVTAGLDTVALRMPAHPVALELIREAGFPVAAPSANLSGRPSPTAAEHVIRDLAGKIPVILDGGQTEVGLESTVIDLTGRVPVILRPGGVTYEELKSILGEVDIDPGLLPEKYVPRSPGMKYTHYSPRATVILVGGSIEKIRQVVQAIAEREIARGKRVGIMATEQTLHCYSAGEIISVGDRDNPSTIASNLFAVIREFDDRGVDVIVAEGIDEKGIGLAVMNRLKKASGFNIVDADAYLESGDR
jgi:L-threonylcarbamoyladenylate synthase